MLPVIEKRRSRGRITSGGGGCGGHVTSVEVAHYTGGGPDRAYAATERLRSSGYLHIDFDINNGILLTKE
jgi:hypothetical protein